MPGETLGPDGEGAEGKQVGEGSPQQAPVPAPSTG
jgi:hypothetical protein